MKTLTASLLIFAYVILASCKKQNPTPGPDPVPETVTIQGSSYPVIKAGNKWWTASNYAGPGGIGYAGTPARPEYGKYYTYNEAKAIALPSGWRLPTADDYVALAQSQGVEVSNYQAHNQDAIRKLTSVLGWLNVPGSNISGFNARPAGYMFQGATPVDGDISEFWTAEGKTMSIQETAIKALRLIFYADNTIDAYRFTLRFVRDN